ncbi:MAG: sugar ABC transporter substrate-binding protein [Selenomonas ruminantium]|nr:sugar ABC transporter substrate-binding protein [Selenomonas ruminantium]
MLQLVNTDLSARQTEGRRKLGAVYMTLNNPFYEVVDEEIRTAVENRGDVLITRDPALSVERQNAEIEELIKDGVELIFINPVDWRKCEPAIEKAWRAGVPVIALDTNVEDDAHVASTVVSDNYLAGQQCARHLVAHRQTGKVALLNHSQARSAQDRIKGFLDVLSHYPAFQVVDQEECRGQLETAMPAMERMIERHPEIDVVMALNDPAAMGAMAALRQAGRLEGVAVYGVDGVTETRDLIAQGHMQATAGQDPRGIGRLAVEEAYKVLQGKTPNPLVKLPTVLITKENAANEEQEGWD